MWEVGSKIHLRENPKCQDGLCHEFLWSIERLFNEKENKNSNNVFFTKGYKQSTPSFISKTGV